MSELRKTILASILISVVVGFMAGGTAGVLATQLVAREGVSALGGLLPSAFRKAVKPMSEGVEGLEGIGGGGGEVRPPATDDEAATIEVVSKVSPSVVSLVISREISARSTGPLFNDEFFEQFGLPFRLEVPQQPSRPQRRQVGGGTGFIITEDGMIVTNKHVVADQSAQYTVVTAEGKRFEAKVLASDPFIDIGILKIEAKDLPTVRLGNSDRLRIGETVIAIGNALSEFRNTVTKGVVSGINRRITAGGPGVGSEVIEEAIQTDAAINPGNSGGPLVNLHGEVVGVNTAVSSSGQSLGFAIPINQIKPIIESVKKEGRIVRPWLGVRYVIITPELKEQERLPVDYGALIVRGESRTEVAVIPGSPADKAGLKENDIILELGEVKITEENPLARQIQKRKPGDKVQLKILREGKEQMVEAVLEELKQ